MSRPSPSAASISRLLEKLSSGNEREAIEASKALAALAAASDRDARRLAQGGALPALVQALRRARNPARVAVEPGALQALCSALGSSTRETFDSAAAVLCRCAMGSPRLARLVGDTPGLLAAMVGVTASSNAPTAARCAVFTFFEVAAAGADLAARVVSTPGAVRALSQMLVQCSDDFAAERAAAVFSQAAKAGPQHADAIATPDVLAALVSAAGRAGMGEAGMGALAGIACASLPLALRVADAPGAEAAMLAALTGGDLKGAINAAIALSKIARLTPSAWRSCYLCAQWRRRLLDCCAARNLLKSGPALVRTVWFTVCLLHPFEGV
jgi:hypothetical protein